MAWLLPPNFVAWRLSFKTQSKIEFFVLYNGHQNCLNKSLLRSSKNPAKGVRLSYVGCYVSKDQLASYFSVLAYTSGPLF